MSDSRQTGRARRATMALVGSYLDDERCWAAMQGRDPRFDGWFVVAVASTGIYCRPSCPARTPKRCNVRFFPTAAAAQEDGFRACRRCRPDATPGSPEWRGRADVAGRAMQLVLDGVVDRDGVPGLARRLDYSPRQLHRVLIAELGAGAAALARAQRAQTARLLLDRSELPVSAVAFAAGFTSVRQFNDTVRLVFACTPTELRRAARRRGDRSAGEGRSAFGASKLSTRAAAAKAGATTGSTRAVVSGAATVMLRLAYRAPLAAGELLAFLGARCVPGIEVLDGDGYHRTLALHHGDGTVCLQPGPGYVQAAFCLSDLRDLASAVARCRHLFGLDADPAAVDGALATDPQLHPFVARFPGLRVPGAVDGFEVAVRAVVGQQVSLAQARRLLGQMVAACGDPLSDAVSHGAAELGLEHTFPRPEQLAELVTSSAAPPWFPGPAHRRRALDELAEAVVSGRLVIDPGAAPDELRRRMLELHGVGPWTAEYVAMRALGDPDAFMPSDLALRRAASRLGLMSTPSALVGRAERWRPWRAHAQMHLWNLDAAWSRAVSLAAGSRLEDLDRGSAA